MIHNFVYILFSMVYKRASKMRTVMMEKFMFNFKDVQFICRSLKIEYLNAVSNETADNVLTGVP